jgi:hypothetical protein
MPLLKTSFLTIFPPMLGTMTHRMNSKTIPAEHESVFDKEVGLLTLKGKSIGLPVYRLFSKKEG